jgi:hypothetical protein
LLQVERGWRDMKMTLELRPVYHRLEDRIRAHVILCWLALLLVRIVETTTGDTWNRIREDLQELHVGTFKGPAGTFGQRTELTTAQRDILTQLGVDAPKKIIELGRGDVLTSTNTTAWTQACPGCFRRPRRSNPRFRVQHQHQLRNPGLIPMPARAVATFLGQLRPGVGLVDGCARLRCQR